MSVLQFDSFSPHLGSAFVLDLGEATVDLTLTDAARTPASAYPGMAREPFSLIFRSNSQAVLPQRLYPLSHPALGRLEIFIVPVAREADGVVYQAVFN